MIAGNIIKTGLSRMFLCCFGVLFLVVLCSSCSTTQTRKISVVLNQEDIIEEVPDVVTGDIQAGIEKHIDEQVKIGNGYFHVPFEDKDLKLDLVRVHTEYLATLTPTSHFACVDMVDTSGEFYDIDFFMEGRPGDMKVTETTVHKINGQPLYVWEQAEDKSWGRVPMDEATNDLLGIIEGKDKFLFRYETSLPKISKEAKIWIPLAQSNDYQKVNVVSIDAPVGHQVLNESIYGNKALFFKLRPEDSGKKIVINYDVERLEKNAYEGSSEEASHFLGSNLKVPLDDRVKAFAEEIVQGKEGDLMRARMIYDKVIDMMAYKRCGVGWGEGDVSHAQNKLSGNCTDFHSYFIALARSIGIPARFAIGVSIPSERNEGSMQGYHCWAEFYAEGKWWPIDISEANKFTSLSMYYFGHHPANRLEFTSGRDLVFEPGPSTGPINFMAYPVMEVDGKPYKAEKFFGFERKNSM